MLMRKLTLLLLSAALVMGLSHGAVAAGEAIAHFELKLDDSDTDVKLTIVGHGLTDMYAYDFELSYDDSILSFNKAETSIAGYSVKPILGSNTLRIAHTKMGEIEGEIGDVALSTITFRRIGAGATTIKLNSMQLVDSKLDMVALTPEVTITVIDDLHKLSFKDVDGHWAEASIYEAARLGFVTGYGDETFRPNLAITRAEFMAMIVRALQMKTSHGSGFTFQDNHQIPAWAKDYVQTAHEAKLTTGYTDGTFRANKRITRSEAASIIVRALALDASSDYELPFVDRDSIPVWAIPSVKTTVEFGIMIGNAQRRFVPLSPTTRAEAVTIIVRMLNTKRAEGR